MSRIVKPVNWNQIEDPIDLEVWNKLVANSWVPEKIALSNDIPSWRNMTKLEKETTKKVFIGLTLLDTIQATVGAISLMPDSSTPHEESILCNIAFMEAVHSKSYSSIFSTLCSTEEIDEAFRWSIENPQLKKKAEIVLDYYDGNDPLKRKIASVLLESFLFYSGFYWPFYLSSRARLTNSADIVRLIVRDESVHGYYIGYKFQRAFAGETPARQAELREFAVGLLFDLYENEVLYTQDLYDELGLTEDVKRFLRYNANKAFANLGFDPVFPADTPPVSPEFIGSLSLTSETHDFFSGGGSSYIMGKAEETDDEDWDF